LLVLATLCTGVGCGGCSPLYLIRSAYEEGRILWSREPIKEVLAQPGFPADERAKLELVLAVRDFASTELGMNVGGAYASYARVPPDVLLWVVSGAERTALKPVTWWFPVVGDVTYKGFFEQGDAVEEATRLKSDGYDTLVRPSAAFSTLGWFDDPVLSSWLRDSRVALVALVLHELLHRTIYVPGHTDFNESFATFVGHRGAMAYFAAREGGGAASTQEASRVWREELERSEQWGRAVEELRALYGRARSEEWPEDRTLEERKPIFAALGPLEKINNAVILAGYAYLAHLDRFECAYAARGEDLRATISEIRAKVKGAEKPFAQLAACTRAPASGGADRAASLSEDRG
jgi:predicted aminopeptidase